jgi:FkbM family methyltransferase
VLELSGYKEDRGLVVPAWDNKIAYYLHESLPHIDMAVKHCRGRKVVVQAGGNCGLWPMRLSGLFDTVYTFEPDPVNFTALAINTAGRSNIIKMQAALGNVRTCVDMNRTGKNCGAHYVEGYGSLPTIKIDDLALAECDLIYLDVEGFEYQALRGAIRTIDTHAPVVAFEDKGLGKRFGVEQGAIETMMVESFGYRTVERANNDTIMVKE